MIILSIEEWISTVLVNALGYTFVHSLWIALAALLVSHIAMSLMKNIKPSIRYNTLLMIFGLLVLSILFTFSYQLQYYSGMSVQTTGDNVSSNIFAGTHTAVPVMMESKRIMIELQRYFNEYVQWLVAVWFIICSIKSLKFSLHLTYLDRISKFESVPVSEHWQQLLNKLRGKLGVTAPVQMLQSFIVRMPMVKGYLKPVILVPAGMLTNLSPDLIEQILLHELAHVRRRDYLVNMIQSVCDTVFFFNPFLLKLSGLIRDEREACCDYVAVNATNNKVNYVQALVAFGNFSTGTNVVQAFSGSKNQLLQRVKRILYNQNKKPGIMEKSVLFTSAVLLFSFAAFTSAETERKSQTLATMQVTVADTIPDKDVMEEEKEIKKPKRAKRMREAQRKMEKKQQEMQDVQRRFEFDQQQMQQELQETLEMNQENIKEAIKSADVMNKIELQNLVELKMQEFKNVDMEKILKDVDMAKISADIKMAELDKIMYDIDLKAMNHDLKTAMDLKNFNFDFDFDFDNNINNEVTEILAFLHANNVASSGGVKTFSLTAKELVVNGTRQSSQLHDQLKKKYISRDDDHIIYSKSKGNTSITIQRNSPNSD